MKKYQVRRKLQNSVFALDKKIAFYSEWWRYKGPGKPRQPLRKQEGASLSEKSNNKRIVYETLNSPIIRAVFLHSNYINL